MRQKSCFREKQRLLPVNAHMENTNSGISSLLSACISEVSVLPVCNVTSGFLKKLFENSLKEMCLFLSLNALQEWQWGIKTPFVISVWLSDPVNLN